MPWTHRRPSETAFLWSRSRRDAIDELFYDALMRVKIMRMSMTFFVLALLVLSGCATPMMHPLRVDGDGGFAEAQVMAVRPEGRTGGCDNSQGCVDNPDGGGGFAISPIQLSGGLQYKPHKFIGLLGGLYLPAWVNQKKNFYQSPAAAYSYATVQNDYFSIGAGPGVGLGGWSVTAGVEGGVPEIPRFGFPVRLGVFGRYFRPFRETFWEFNSAAPSWEAGARLSVHSFYAQYNYYEQTRGVMNFLIYETSTYLSAMHQFSIGVTIGPGDFERGLFK